MFIVNIVQLDESIYSDTIRLSALDSNTLEMSIIRHSGRYDRES